MKLKGKKLKQKGDRKEKLKEELANKKGAVNNSPFLTGGRG